MNNSSITNKTDNYFHIREELIGYIINGFVASVAVYLIIVLSICLSKINLRRSLHNVSQEKKQSIISKILCLLVAFCILFRTLSYFGYAEMRYWTTVSNKFDEDDRKFADTSCNVILSIDVFSLTIGTGLVYAFLWLRQRIFYINPGLKSITNKFTTVLSTVIIFAWFLYFLTSLTLYLIFVRYRFDSEYLCVTTDDTSRSSIYSILISWIIATLIMEIVLLGLFIYPLIKHNKWKQNSSLTSKSSNLLLHRIRKATLLTMIASVSDILGFVTSFFVRGPISIVIFNLSLLLNLFSAIGCFDNWRNMIFPCNKTLFCSWYR